jgi:hypothetical protein
MAETRKPRLWLTYAWADNEEGDFSYLVQELDAAGIDVTYDRIALVPGRRLWDQIGAQITRGPYDGWAYLLTPNSLHSEACREELAYALYRVLRERGEEFPLVGLLHGVRIDDVPPSLAVRLCVSLASPSWKEEVRAGLERRPPRIAPSAQTQYVWRIHRPYGGVGTQVAIEVRPRFAELMYWRFAVPASATVVRWGHGPSGGGAIASRGNDVVEGGTGEIGGTRVAWFGAGDRLSAGISAYVVFDGLPPDFVCFGAALEAFGPPAAVESIDLRNVR